MRKYAEMYHVENGKQMQTISAKNSMRSYCFNIKTVVKDDKLKEKISESDKNTIFDQGNELLSCLNANQLA
jgi:L1 cell adhesion molecule like protein